MNNILVSLWYACVILLSLALVGTILIHFPFPTLLVVLVAIVTSIVHSVRNSSGDGT